MNPLISVILPVYNMEAYLARCLDSVLNSTYQNLEILCVDDGSRDRSLEILREYEAKDSRIVVIAKENGGVSSARNAGLDRMTGEFVTFIDPDDFIHPQMMELFIKAQRITGADIVIGNYSDVQEKDLPMETVLYEETTTEPQMICWKNVFRNYYYGAYCWGRLISKKTVLKKRFPEGIRIAEDSIFFTSLWDHPDDVSCCVIQERLYYYFSREDSVAHMINNDERVDAVWRFLRPSGSSPREERKVLYVFGITRLLRHFDYFSRINSGERMAKKVRRIMLTQVLRVTFFRYFSLKEKLRYFLMTFFPKLEQARRK